MDKDDLKALRLSLGLTQEQFARLLGVTLNTVQKWEGGRRAPSPLAVRGIQAVVEEYRCGQKQPGKGKAA